MIQVFSGSPCVFTSKTQGVTETLLGDSVEIFNVDHHSLLELNSSKKEFFLYRRTAEKANFNPGFLPTFQAGSLFSP